MKTKVELMEQQNTKKNPCFFALFPYKTLDKTLWTNDNEKVQVHSLIRRKAAN